MGRINGDDDEKPVHSVMLSAFRIGATPVPVAVWKEYCIATGTALPPTLTDLDDEPVALNDYDPVVGVSWEDIMGVNGSGGFCAWASGIAGLKLTLPSEAQWEYAARGGIDGQEYPWGHSFDPEKVWYCTGKDLRELLEKLPAPVNRKFKIYRNSFGLTDMAGNVWQWCSDWYGPYRA
jgi:formylglycine-generating enzyme required for sulfatase activity